VTERYWAVFVPPRRYEQERLVAADRVRLSEPGPDPGDRVVLVADLDQPAIFGLGRVAADRSVTYTRRLLDTPLPAAGLVAGPLDPGTFSAIEAAAGSPPARRTWLVSVDLPIEAESPADAVRQFWGYVRELGPGELPAYVWPAGEELAMQAYVLGTEANLDPEEDE
jgi:hypothetical protein